MTPPDNAIQVGPFLVSPAGTVWRQSGSGWEVCRQYPSSREGKYFIVAATVEGEQIREYVHRLVAKGFLPNPQNLPQVNHLDGNGHNNQVENLQWCTASQNVRHAYDTGLADPYRNGVKCHKCGRITRAEDGICPECKYAIQRAQLHHQRVAWRKEQAARASAARLSPMQKVYVDLRGQGLTYEAIGRQFGVTRQAVECAIKNAMRKEVRK